MHQTDSNDTPQNQARRLIETARLAPSVHNVQPWYFRLHGNILQLHVSNERLLHAGDPTTRELWLSIGIMFETIIQTAAALGIAIKITDVQTHSLTDPIALIAILPNRQTASKATLAIMQNRHTHRGALSEKPVASHILKSINSIKTNGLKGVDVLATDDKTIIKLASKLTQQGLTLAFSSTAFRHELSHLIHPNWTRARTGLPGFVLQKGIVGSLWEKWSLRFNLDNVRKAKTEARRVQQAPLLIFIATRGDVPAHWFNAGRAYTLLTHNLTRNNLLHSTVAAPIEAADLHEELEAALHTKLRLQCMLLAGYAQSKEQKKAKSPRLTVDELLLID